ncbi:chromosome segregation protein SMC [Izhakiella australiensis]|uniref:Chromosome segregation protein SMC n=1 Tax=Izhakiella australiensis TaxID=1926881 RepID=A0A1S8Y6U6_9GAMM|nr:AAA family ATPase [Izhakiella australiensis]OON34760.1 chromosome segregation protein SMC [Izhakiella australiensis]
MSINKLTLAGFRSVRNIELELAQLNVISGPNGCGKSNLYKAVRLLHEAACGRLSSALAEEGGIQKAMWAGGLRRGDKRSDAKRLMLAVEMDDFDYQLEIGFPEPLISLFNLDPLVKKEGVWQTGFRRRPSSQLLDRQNQTAFLSNINGERVAYPASLHPEDSVFGQLAEPHLYPEISQVRESLRSWRFYHEFAVWPHSPLRSPQVGIRSPVLAHDGANLAAAFETIRERGHYELLEHILQQAFADSRFFVEEQSGRFQIMMERSGILRPLESAELSDGTLRFLCLVVALLSPRPPAFMALNEPENSLHPDMLPSLALLIGEASRYSQLWVTSHSPTLAELIARHVEVKHYTLAQREGETVII